MAIPPAHQRALIQFNLNEATGGGTEIAEFGVAITGSALDDMAMATAISTAFGTAWGGSGVGGLAVAAHTGCRVQSIDATGKVASSAFSAAGAGGSGTNSAQALSICCSALTLVTGQRDGKGTLIYGRIYPPACAAGYVGSTTTLANAQTYATAWASVMNSVQTASGGSIVVASSSGLGLVPVTGINGTTVIDTQRRRKNGVTLQRTTTAAL